jgi:hypothetical protein
VSELAQQLKKARLRTHHRGGSEISDVKDDRHFKLVAQFLLAGSFVRLADDEVHVDRLADPVLNPSLSVTSLSICRISIRLNPRLFSRRIGSIQNLAWSLSRSTWT